jgi:hypothetical protein
MKLKAIFVGLAGVCLLGGMSLACGSSSKSDNGTDGGTSDDASPVDGEAPGLAAAAKTIGFPPMCESCINTHCASEFEDCWAESRCKKIEICTGECIEKEGGTPLACTTGTCAADSGPGSALNMCLVGECAKPCGG